MDGYMIEVEYVDDVLTVRGKNKAARMALAGPDHATDVTVPRSEIASAEYKPARMVLGMVNGNLIITTTAGKKYQLHFRKKQQADFEALARQLGATGVDK